MRCPICSEPSVLFVRRDDVDYFECTSCASLFADPGFLAGIDRSGGIQHYGEKYWQCEIQSARERSYGRAQ